MVTNVTKIQHLEMSNKKKQVRNLIDGNLKVYADENVDKHNSNIWVESKVGKGTDVKISFQKKTINYAIKLFLW